MQQQSLLSLSPATRPSICVVQCGKNIHYNPSTTSPLKLSYLQCSRAQICRRIRLNRSCIASAVDSEPELPKTTPVRWVLEPVGDGNCRHIGQQIPMPSAFELSSDSVTVGRVEDKADIVISVPTVSGVHARLEKKETVLMVTDLDSTNGTFLNRKRLRPGAVTPVPSGSSITFGDEHLAQFRFSLINEENASD